MRRFLLVCACVFLIAIHGLHAQTAVEVASTKIWDAAPHNAFPSLVWYRGKFVCAFRESSAHVGTDGIIRILASKDGKQWQSVTTVLRKGIDLRDPKLSVTPSGKLMLLIGGSVYQDKKLVSRAPRVSYFDDVHRTFSEPADVVIADDYKSGADWIWSLTWHGNIGYGVDYYSTAGQPGSHIALLRTNDGTHFSGVSRIPVNGSPNETRIRFAKDGTLFALVRREADDKLGALCKSVMPYTNFRCTPLTVRIGGEDFQFLDAKTFVAGTREYIDGKPHAVLLKMDLNGQILKRILLA